MLSNGQTWAYDYIYFFYFLRKIISDEKLNRQIKLKVFFCVQQLMLTS